MSPLDGPSSPQSLYVELVAHGVGDAFDRHVFACVLAIAASERDRALTEAVGLDARRLHGLSDTYFPRASSLLPSVPPDAGTGEDALEEPDLRQLLLDHRTRGIVEEEWLAAIIARRALRPNHLWQDLGLFNRSDLGRLLRRHFEPLAQRNDRDMKWKKFFYRELCARDGVLVCKSPVCDVCSDFAHCFGSEDADPLLSLQKLSAA